MERSNDFEKHLEMEPVDGLAIQGDREVATNGSQIAGMSIWEDRGWIQRDEYQKVGLERG